MNTVDATRFGFVYVATGARYVVEALHSAGSLRRQHPDIPICLITDAPPGDPGPFSEIRPPIGPVEHRPIDKLLAYEAPFEFSVFLDTDTHVIDNLTPLFRLLEQFDLALVQDVNRGWNYDLPGVPLSFSEFNTGVIAFRKSEAMASFFREWRDCYIKLKSELDLINDQPSFRQALFFSRLRVAPLPSEFHFLGDFPNSLLWKVRLVHARGDYGRIERQVNERLGLRAYLPEIGVFPAYTGRSALLATLARTVWRMVRLLLRGPESVTEKHPSKWWLEEGKGKGRKGDTGT